PKVTLPVIYGPTFDHAAAPSQPVTGVVRDKATGKPLAGAPVNGSAAGSWGGGYVTTETHDEGRYRLTGLAQAGREHIRATTGMKRNYLPAEKPLADAEGLAALTLDFDLVKGIRVSGRVTEKGTGKPVDAALWYFPLADNKAFRDLPGNDFYKN